MLYILRHYSYVFSSFVQGFFVCVIILNSLSSIAHTHNADCFTINLVCVMCFRKQSSLLNVSKDRRDQAASTIQSNWRRRQATKKQHRYQRETEQAIVDLQSTFKAHLARKKAVSAQNIDPSPSHSLPGDSSPSHPLPGASAKLESEAGAEGDSCSGADDEESVELIQAALRGYLTRQMALQDFKQKRWDRKDRNRGVKGVMASLHMHTPIPTFGQ